MKLRKGKYSFIILLIILGMLIAFQLKISQLGYKYVHIIDLDNLQKSIDKEKAELLQLELQKNELVSKKNAYEEGNLTSILTEDALKIKKFAGLTPLEGPGVVIVVTDAVRDLGADEDPNNLLVHDYDIRSMINDIQMAGAEAISINGQRILFNKTDLYCTGPTIRINSQVFAQPFVIKAIGDQNRLMEVIDGPKGYANILRDMGIFVEANTAINMRIEAYETYEEPKYLNVEDGADQ